MINQGDNADVTNNEIKSLINKLGDSISFCDPEKKKQSFAFFLSIEVQGEINSLRNVNVVKTAAIEVRKSLLAVNFRHESSFCDHTSPSNLGKKQKFRMFFSSFFV